MVTVGVAVLVFGPAVDVLKSVQPGTVGDHPFRKGLRATSLLTLGVVAILADPLCLTALEALGVPTVQAEATE